MGNIVSKVPLKDGTVRYLADSEARTRITTLETLLDGHSIQANVPQDAVFTDTVIQYNTLPAPSAEYTGQIYQYIGETDANFTNGHFYKCTGEDIMPNPGVYTGPDGQNYKYYIHLTGNNDFDVYSNYKLCCYGEPYSGNYGYLIWVYSPTRNEIIDLGTRGHTYYPLANTMYNLPELIVKKHSETDPPAYAWTAFANKDTKDGFPYFETQEEAILYLSSSDYRWEEIDVSSTYELPIATNETLGGIKIGDNLSIDENGILSAEDPIQVSTMTTPSASLVGKVVQFIGISDANYTSGYFYKCVEKIPTAKYTAPDGNTYKHKITGTGQSWYTVYSNKKICFVDDPAYYSDNGGVRVYKPFGISSPSCGFLETEERTNTAIFRTVYPSSGGWQYDGNYQIFLTDSTVPSSTTEIWFPVSGNEETPVVSSAEAAYNYLNSPDLIYVWERVDVQPEPAPYTLPAATESTLGGIKVGDNLSINNEGVLSAEDPDQYSILPTPSAEYANRIVQYVGDTNENFTNGYFYKCIIDTNAPYTGAKLMAVFNDAMDQQYENVALFNAIVDRWSQDTTLQCGFYAVDPSHCGLSHSITTDATWMYFSQTWYRSDNLSPSTQTTNWQTITSDGSQQHGNKYVILDSFYNDYPGFEEYKWEQVNVQDDQNTVIQYEVLPTPSAENESKIYQYIGEDTADYDNGYFYKCEKDPRIPEEGSYTAPDGNTYKTKMTATSYWALTLYTNRKYCFVEGRYVYYNNVKQYLLCVADKHNDVDCLGYIGTMEYQTDAKFNSFYPGSVVSQWLLSDTKVYEGTSVHAHNSSFGYSRAAFPNVPYFETAEEALAYLLAPDYQWNSIGVQSDVLFGVCNTNRNIAEKVVSIPNLDKLMHGTQIRVLFDDPNVDHDSMTTLNVNNLGAYKIVTRVGTEYQLPTWKRRVPVSFTFYEYPNDDPVWILENLYEPTYVTDVGNDETIEADYPDLVDDIERIKQPGHIFKIDRNDTNDEDVFTAFKPTGWDEMYETLTDAAEKADAADQDLNTSNVTVTGKTVNFTTRIAQKAKETALSLEPIQDLNGYDGPWPAGGGKNKWGNGNISGTAYSDITLASPIAAGTYTLSAMVDSTDTDASTCLVFDVTNNTSLGTIGRSTDNFRKAITFTTADTISTIRFYASASSEQSAGDALYFMEIQLEEGSTATDLVPYSNECPVDGYTEASLLGCGKNLVKPDTPYSENPYEYNGCTFTLHDDGSLEVVTIPSGATGNATYEYNKGFELPADTYEFLGCPKNAGNNISFYLNSGFTYRNIYESGDGAVFTISEPKSGKLYLKVDSGAVITTPIVFKPMVTTDLTATYDDFEPYTVSNDLTLQFGEKVYNANVDVENGIVTIDKGYAVYDGSEDEDWHKRSSSDTFFIDVADMKNGDELDGISNLFTNVTSHNDFGIRFGDEDARIYLYQLVSQISEITDLETFKTYLSNHNLQVVYPLAAPRTIQLTPNKISLLSGVNNISTDGDSIKLTYRNGKVATLGDLEGLTKKIVDCEDVEITDLQDGHSLVYDSTEQKWINSHLGYDAPVIYSTEEREIGVWTDGKPLYQKTFVVAPSSATVEIDTTLLAIDKLLKIDGTFSRNSVQTKMTLPFSEAGNTNYGLAMDYNKENEVLALNPRGYLYTEIDEIRVTIQYTKTTDEPGSGKWTTMGVPAHHYDNTERIVGTWFGETLYQKSYTAVWQSTAAEEIIDSSIIDTSAQIRNLSGTWAVGLYGYEGSEQADIHQPIYFATTGGTITPPIFKLKSNGFVIQRSQSGVGIEYSITIQYTKSSS